MSSEIIFNPLRFWFTRGGPFTKIFRTLLWSPIPPHTKWGIMAYMFSYYALSLAWSLSLLNYALIGCLGMISMFDRINLVSALIAKMSRMGST